MTIAQLIETLCLLVGEMADLTDSLAMRLLQAGCMTEGEAEQLNEIHNRIEAIGISPPQKEITDSLNSGGVGH